MEKILFIAPHLSTGGLPQYLVKKIELLKGEFEIYLIEYNNSTGGKLVIQKNKILDLVDEDKFFMLDDNKEETLEIIDKIKPNIIHLEEIPEYFMNYDLARKIYNVDRDYFIVETSHAAHHDMTSARHTRAARNSSTHNSTHNTFGNS